MEDDAILEDVSQEEVEPVVSPREAAMQQIIDQLGKGEDPGALPSWVPVPDRAYPPEPADKEEPAPVATPQTVRVKVDGEEKELPVDEVVKGYQKDSVASRRLEEAARKMKEVEQREAAISERERQIQAIQAPSPEDDEDGDEIQAAIDALVEGDNAAAAKLLRDAVKKGRQPASPAVNATELAAQIKADLAAEREQDEHNKAMSDFLKANPAFADPAEGEPKSNERVMGDHIYVSVYLPKVAAGEISYREALNKTAEDVAKVFTPAPAPNAREERKKTVNNLPTAGSARQTQSTPPQTALDVIDEMKKMRGQV